MITSLLTTDETGASLKNLLNQDKIGNMWLGISKQIAVQKPRERRPHMALMTENMTKTAAEKLLSNASEEAVTISNSEWCNASNHAKYPGALKPIEVVQFHRNRVCVKELGEFLGYVQENNLQHHAFGTKEYITATGATVLLDKMSTTANATKIMRDYSAARCNDNDSSSDENKCDKRCPNTNKPCILEKGHKNTPGQHRCKFTDKKSLSGSTIRKILDSLTNGHLTSLAGLDDEDTIKGGDNIKRCLEIADILSTDLNLPKNEANDIKNRIEQVLIYHKTDFPEHISRHGKKVCQCISCGLHAPDEHVPCQFREDDAQDHEGPCADCEASFQVFSDLLELSRRTQAPPNLSPVQQEKYYELEIEIQQCRTNFFQWRAHIVRKVVESEYANNQMKSLGIDEAIVVSDFKMKILPRYFRENQKKFFAKRGTACLGFMVLSNQEKKEGLVDAHYFLFFSNDTTQDTTFVLSAKAYVYDVFIRSHFQDVELVKVHFESDGAGAFNSNLAKACQPEWYEWTNGKIEEVQIRVSVNGDGKTSLDGIFGKTGKLISDAVNNQITDVVDAESCLKAYQHGAGIIGCTAAIILPNRESPLITSETRLKPFHRMVLDREKKEIICQTSSGYGDGSRISFASITQRWKCGPPTMPKYNVTTQIPSTKSETNSTHFTECKQSRQNNARMSKHKAREAAHTESMRVKFDAAFKRGLYLCQEPDPSKTLHCKCEFGTARGLEMHKNSGRHRFPSKNMLDTAAQMVSGADGMLRVGSHKNRANENGTYIAIDGSGAGTSEGDGWHVAGCYRKPSRAKSYMISTFPKLENELTRMFYDGEKNDGNKQGRQKYTAEEARKELCGMRQENGLLTFSSKSEHGHIPSIAQIKSVWARIRKKITSKNAKSFETEDADIEMDLEDDDIGPDIADESCANGNSGNFITNETQGVEDVANGNTKCLEGKTFFITGTFPEVGGGNADKVGVDNVEAMIKSFGGKVQLSRFSKYTSEFSIFCLSIHVHEKNFISVLFSFSFFILL